MGKVLEMERLNFFNRYAGLVHGFSPRNFITTDGKKQELRVGRLNMKDASMDHRRLLMQSLDLKTDDLFLMNQVHGNDVYVLKDSSVSCSAIADFEADAIVTHLVGKPIGVLTADCVPILLYDPVYHVAGAVHAGRKGTQKRILTATLETMSREYGCLPENLIMGLGPAIGECCYELDKACVSEFLEGFGEEGSSHVREEQEGRYYLNLIDANIVLARQAGIKETHIHTLNECTACMNHRWYSYRREGQTGRIISLAMLRS